MRVQISRDICTQEDVIFVAFDITGCLYKYHVMFVFSDIQYSPVGQVCLVLLMLTNQLAGFPAPIPFRFAYFCHAFPVNKYPRNSPART